MTAHLSTAKVVLVAAGAAATAGSALVVANVDHNVAIALIAQLPAIITALGVIVMAAFSYAMNVKMTKVAAQTDGLTRALVKTSVDAAIGPSFTAGVEHEKSEAAKRADASPTVKEVVQATIAEVKKQNGDSEK